VTDSGLYLKEEINGWLGMTFVSEGLRATATPHPLKVAQKRAERVRERTGISVRLVPVCQIIRGEKK